MSLLDMVDQHIRRQWWNEVKKDPNKRAAIRKAAQAVLDAEDSSSELDAMIALRNSFPR